jgi:SAM-dependent methyltransferase
MARVEFAYKGNELELFKRAENWKRYWSAQIRPHLGQRVLEVGAGIGSNTPYLIGHRLEWICLEPDRAMAQELVSLQRAGRLTATDIVAGTITDLPSNPTFDSIIYIDVLEHIKDDAAEIAAAAARLRAGGKLIVLSPAHNWLFSPFDAAIGHYRRYSPSSLRAVAGPNLELTVLRQLDSVGMLVSIANRFLLRPESPSQSQILLWDRMMVPISRLIDPLIRYRIGKSVFAIWRRI